MNRRNFLKTIFAGGAAAVLPLPALAKKTRMKWRERRPMPMHTTLTRTAYSDQLWIEVADATYMEPHRLIWICHKGTIRAQKLITMKSGRMVKVGYYGANPWRRYPQGSVVIIGPEIYKEPT